MTTQSPTLNARAIEEPKAGFTIKDIPNAILGFFGIRTESELPYETRCQDGSFSLRYYPPHAEIRNEEVGTRKQAANTSFERLFSYIQGENWESETFSMTIPMLQKPTGAGRWVTAFYMNREIEHLPLPKSSAVRLYSMNSEMMAVVRFTGRLTDSNIQSHIAKLRSWMDQKNLSALGEPEIAQFDQPFAIPFLRRNEIHIPVDA